MTTEGTQMQLSLQRKRARDRNAQRNARDRRALYISQLEQQVAFCRAHHGNHPVNPEHPYPHSASIECVPPDQTTQAASALPGTGTFRVQVAVPAAPSSPQRPPSTDVAAQLPVAQPMALQWSVKPLSDPHDALGQAWSPWLSCPDVLSLLPETPRPRDLLRGTKKNPVTDSIHNALSRFGCFRDIEKVAVGWTIYVYTKWLTAPTQPRYLRLPEYLHLTPLQISCKHPASIDGIVWPQIRDNMIRHMAEDELEDVFALFSACVKLRWSIEDSMVVKKDSRAVDINPAFLDTLMVLENWYLEPPFAQRYPFLVAGMHPSFFAVLDERATSGESG